MTKSKKTFGQRTRELRKEQRISLKELADRAEISYAYMSKIESDLHVPGLETAVKIFQVLGGSVEEAVELSQQLPADILEQIIEDRQKQQFIRAARSTGRNTSPEEEKRTLIENMPPQLVAALATMAQAGEEDFDQLIGLLDRMAQADPEQRERLIQAVHTIFNNCR